MSKDSYSAILLFKYGYGMESNKMAEYESLDIRGEIDVYVHQNLAEQVTMLSQSVLAGVLSVQTAAEKHPMGANNEFEKIRKEAKEKSDMEAEAKAKENADNIAKQAAAGGDITPEQV